MAAFGRFLTGNVPMAAPPFFEKALVSCAVTLHHMSKIHRRAIETTFVPQHMKEGMPGSAAAVSTFLKGMEEAQRQVQQEAAPYLLEWQAAYGLPIGGVLRTSLMPDSIRLKGALELSGTITALQVYDGLLSTRRALEFTIEDPYLAYAGDRAPFDSLSPRCPEELEKLFSSQFLEHVPRSPARSGLPPAMKVRVGIRREDRDNFWMRINIKLM